MRPGLLLVSAGVCAFAWGCSSSGPRDDRTIAKTGASGAVAGRPTFEMPVQIPGQSTVVVPFAVESRKGLFELDDPYSRGGVGYQYDQMMSVSAKSAVAETSGRDVRWHNAIFRDMSTGDEWAVLDRRGLIGRWEILGVRETPQSPWVSRALVFIAVVADTNRDGSLDNLDARVAILTDADGRRPRFVTPPDAQVWSVAYDARFDTVYFQVARDTDGDGRFTFADVATPYFVSIKGSEQAKPLLSGPIADQAEKLLK